MIYPSSKKATMTTASKLYANVYSNPRSMKSNTEISKNGDAGSREDSSHYSPRQTFAVDKEKLTNLIRLPSTREDFHDTGML